MHSTVHIAAYIAIKMNYRLAKYKKSELYPPPYLVFQRGTLFFCSFHQETTLKQKYGISRQHCCWKWISSRFTFQRSSWGSLKPSSTIAVASKIDIRTWLNEFLSCHFYIYFKIEGYNAAVLSKECAWSEQSIPGCDKNLYPHSLFPSRCKTSAISGAKVRWVQASTCIPSSINIVLSGKWYRRWCQLISSCSNGKSVRGCAKCWASSRGSPLPTSLQ